MKELDSARKYTDKELAKVEKQIDRIYRKSAKGIYTDYQKFMERAQKRIQTQENALVAAIKTNDAKLIAEAEKSLQDAKFAVTLHDGRYREMLDTTAKRIAEVNQIAIDYANDKIPNIYAVNYNQMDEVIKGITLVGGEQLTMRVAFSLVDEHTLKVLAQEGRVRLPVSKRLSVPKDMRWNMKKINSALTQGILQGESMPKIAKRIFPEIQSKTIWKNHKEPINSIIKQNKQSAIRTARTLFTQAENMGRQDSYVNAESMGIVMGKQWISTGDERTRDWHLSMDGQEVPIDETFTDGLGNQLEEPADPSAPPETTYNCRCSMRSIVYGFRAKDGSVVDVEYDRSLDPESNHQRSIRQERERRLKE